MMDAILFSARDAVRKNFAYDYSMCDIMADGHPPSRCGDIYVAVHQKGVTSEMMNALDEYFNWSLTLTMRTKGIPLDRLGDQLLAVKEAQRLGFNNRANLLAAFFHMNWPLIGAANNYLLKLIEGVERIYGFSEPAHFASMETPELVGPEWFGAEPDALEVGLKAEIFFERCRRGPQAIGHYS